MVFDFCRSASTEEDEDCGGGDDERSEPKGEYCGCGDGGMSKSKGEKEKRDEGDGKWLLGMRFSLLLGGEMAPFKVEEE